MPGQKKKTPTESPKLKRKNSQYTKSEIRIPTEPEIIYLGFTYQIILSKTVMANLKYIALMKNIFKMESWLSGLSRWSVMWNLGKLFLALSVLVK